VIALETSMRLMEILRMRRENVDTARRAIFIPKAKGGAREQPMTKSLAAYLQGYLASLPKGTSWLFPSADSATGHTTVIRKAFRRAVIAAGLDPDKILRHTMRHTAITQLCFTNVNLPTLQKFSGHKSLSMLLRYMHANSPHVLASLDKLEERYKKVG